MYFTEKIDVEIDDNEYEIEFEFEYRYGEIHLHSYACEEFKGDVKILDKFTEKMFNKAQEVVDGYGYEKKIEKYENYYF